MYYLGVDHHKSHSYSVVMDKQGRVLWQGRINNCREDIARLRTLCNGLKTHAVLEAGRNWTFMYDMLEEYFDEVKLAHPLKTKAIASAKIKTDKIDARTLAHLLRSDLIPEAYIPSDEARIVRAILRQRMFYVRVQTMLKNRITGLLDRYPKVGAPPTKDLFSKKSLLWLKNRVELPEREKGILTEDIKLLEDVKKRISSSNALVSSLAQGNQMAEYLSSVPGIGNFFALLILYEIDKIERFSSPKKLCSYVGLIPSTWASGNRIFHGRITKQGNRYLRWALIEAIWPAVRKDPSLRAYYHKVKLKKGANRAKVSTARRLLTTLYHILEDKRYYIPGRLPSCLPSCTIRGTSSSRRLGSRPTRTI